MYPLHGSGFTFFVPGFDHDSPCPTPKGRAEDSAASAALAGLAVPERFRREPEKLKSKDFAPFPLFCQGLMQGNQQNEMGGEEMGDVGLLSQLV